MKSSDDRSYLQVHLWRSTSRKWLNHYFCLLLFTCPEQCAYCSKPTWVNPRPSLAVRLFRSRQKSLRSSSQPCSWWACAQVWIGVDKRHLVSLSEELFGSWLLILSICICQLSQHIYKYWEGNVVSIGEDFVPPQHRRQGGLGRSGWGRWERNSCLRLPFPLHAPSHVVLFKKKHFKCIRSHPCLLKKCDSWKC